MCNECTLKGAADVLCDDPHAVLSDLVRDACDEVTDVVARIRESVATSEDGPSRDRDITTLTIFVGELAQAIVQYDDPDPGIEPSE